MHGSQDRPEQRSRNRARSGPTAHGGEWGHPDRGARMILTKRFRFEAAHRLPRYEGPCYHLHGHSYELHVSLEMAVNPETGMTVDFFQLEREVKARVLDR